MFKKKFYTTRDIADELDIGESTVKFWQDQYHSWISYTVHDNNRWYSKEAVEKLRLIAEGSSTGLGRNEIEDILSQKDPMLTEVDMQLSNNSMKHQMSLDGNIFQVLNNLLEVLAAQQQRIAEAQERRASAEEKKAEALEKSAFAEKLKADAMNNIASALNGKHLGSDIKTFFDKVTERDDPDIDNYSELNDENIQDTDLDFGDLAELIDNQSETEAPIFEDIPEHNNTSDLSADGIDIENFSELIDESVESDIIDDNLSQLVDETAQAVGMDIDDLSQLIDETAQADVMDIDDLSQLVDETAQADGMDIDDLSQLVDETAQADGMDIDDLSQLVDETAQADGMDIDDLSQLVDETVQADGMDIDDLSQLVDESEDAPQPEADNLFDLLDASEQAVDSADAVEPQVKAELKSSQSPEKDDYKSKIIAIIINLKEKEGLSAEEAAQRLNSDGVSPISGKDSWENKTISEIYNYIETVRSGQVSAA